MKLPKVYEANLYEKDIYALWEKSGAFTPKGDSKQGSYSVVVPPPNANGNLHLGHALILALEDVAVRYHRMQGKDALLLPGADHAGFETQVVFEKELAKQGKSRFDFSRDELYSQIWDFVSLNRHNFTEQFRRLGAGVDWSRFTFTLEEKIVNRAYETFKKMWDEGLIYRGNRLVNFCTHHGTAFADIEVDFSDVKGHLWHIDYPLTDGTGVITVATTRPETMLGDTAIAVHPDDTRYKDFLGKTVKLPLTERQIPIVTDEMVDMEFGSGAVKITPAHDPNDFDVAERHDLPKVSVIDHEGNMTPDVPEAYRGLSTKEARKLIVQDLKELGHLKKEEDYTHSVGHCYKCGTVIEPLLREQWFINMKPLADRAIKALEAGEIEFYPASKKKQLIQYLEGLKDWNISRQIAWGIPIPAFQNIDDPDDWIFDERVNEEIITIDQKIYRRDPDVFDTWFSSSSWPYATLDYPDGEDFKRYYPLSVMETGFDILYPWVSRMIMFGLYVTNEVPFKSVYLNGLVLDPKGQKMSKSKGNVVNPMEKIDKYGSDALRMGLIAGRSAGDNQPYSEDRLIAARNFCNKLWNMARYISDKIDNPSPKKPEPRTLADHWVLQNMNYCISDVEEHFKNYRFAQAYEVIYHFIWDDVADWYIEASKLDENLDLLSYILETCLKLLHPFAPFVTETIWQTLYPERDLLAVTPWPKQVKADLEKARTFEDIKVIISEIRYIKNELKVREVSLYHKNEQFIDDNSVLIKTFAKLESVQSVSDGSGLNLTKTPYDAWLDIDRKSVSHFIKTLKEKRESYKRTAKRLQSRLNNEGYVKNAPKEVINQTKEQLAENQALLEKIDSELSQFSE